MLVKLFSTGLLLLAASGLLYAKNDFFGPFYESEIRKVRETYPWYRWQSSHMRALVVWVLFWAFVMVWMIR